jgi:Ser/Thr protein kinase RdoA (MazF antagonist)
MLEAARLYFGECRVSVLHVSPGYSGSVFASVESSGKQWLLRRWPAGFDIGQLRFVHWALTESRAKGFEGVPRVARTDNGQTIVEFAGYLYDAQEHLSGKPLSAQYPGVGPAPNVALRLRPGRLRNLAEGVARFHRSTLDLPSDPDRQIAPLSERLSALAAELDQCHDTLLAGAREHAGGKERTTALRWLRLLPRALVAARQASDKLLGSRGAYVLCHGDLWPAHVYFDGRAFVGFVDFESLVFAPAPLDLAQLLGHFGGWDVRAGVLRAYERIAPLAEPCRAALPLEVVADLVGEGFWSLRALYGQPSSETNPGQRGAHALNLNLLFRCLEKAFGEAKKVLS